MEQASNCPLCWVSTLGEPSRAMRWEALPATQPSIIMGSHEPSPFQYIDIFGEWLCDAPWNDYGNNMRISCEHCENLMGTQYHFGIVRFLTIIIHDRYLRTYMWQVLESLRWIQVCRILAHLLVLHMKCNSFVFLLQILSPPPEHQETKRIRITRKILDPSKKSDREPSQRKPSESSENLPNASWIEPIWSRKWDHKRETKPECLMRKLTQENANSVVYLFFLPFRERRGELQRRIRSSGSSGSGGGGQDKKGERKEGTGELHAMKVRHELTVIISNYIVISITAG